MDIEKLAREAGLEQFGPDVWADRRDGAPTGSLGRFAALVVEECCAELMDMHKRTSDHNYYHFAANELRKRLIAQVPPQSDCSAKE